ncbi:ferric-chelate reductase [Pimephales promelas]|nr:ferric-chelate reductase [Pimephales promelas]
MESKQMFLVVCVIGCAVSFIKAEGSISTPTTLTSKISRNECGKTKLCLDNPKGCDPSASSQCFFTSAILTNISLTVELSGNSTGYIALAAGLTSNITQELNIIIVCGNNNGGFFYQTTTLFDNTLGISNIANVNSIQGSVQSGLIQCVFTIPTDIINIAYLQIPIFVDILKGSTNGTVLGAPTSVLGSSVLVDLLDVNSTNVVSTTAGTTSGTTAGTTARTTARTTAKSNANISLTSLLSHVAICLLSIFLHLI